MTGSVGVLLREPYERVDSYRRIGIQCLTETKYDSVVLSHDPVNPDASSIPVSVHNTYTRVIKIPGDAVLLRESFQFTLRV